MKTGSKSNEIYEIEIEHGLSRRNLLVVTIANISVSLVWASLWPVLDRTGELVR